MFSDLLCVFLTACKELLTKNFIIFFLFLLQFHDDANKKKLMIHIHDTMFCSQEVGNGLEFFSLRVNKQN